MDEWMNELINEWINELRKYLYFTIVNYMSVLFKFTA